VVIGEEQRPTMVQGFARESVDVSPAARVEGQVVQTGPMPIVIGPNHVWRLLEHEIAAHLRKPPNDTVRKFLIADIAEFGQQPSP